MFDWNGYLKISESLLKLGKNHNAIDEACYRCSVSRAYYYVFNKARKFAENNGHKHDATYNGRKHQEIIDFLNSKNKSVASSYLSKLKKKRELSDYDEGAQVGEAMAETAMLWVGTVENNL